MKRIIFLLFFISMAGLSYAQTLTGVEVLDSSIRVTADSPFTYTVYKPADPYMVVVELPGVSIGAMKDRIVPDKGGVSEIRLSETGTSAKLEITLEAPNSVEPLYQGNTLTLSIKETAPETKAPSYAQAPKEEPQPPQEQALPQATEIRDVRFAREAGYINLLIRADGVMKPTIFTLDGKIVIDIPGVSMKAELPEAVVAPAKAIRYGLHKDKVRIVIDLKEKADFEAKTLPDSMIIAFKAKEEAKAEVAPTPPPPTEEAKPIEKPLETKYGGKPISLDFQNADIVPIFRLLGDVAGYNTVIHPQVSGKITLKLINVPWEQALDIMLETFNLERSIEGNVLTIAPSGVFAKRKEDIERLKEASERAEPLVQEIIAVNYDDADSIKQAVENAKLKSPKGSITIHKRTNSLIVQDTKDRIAQMKELIAKLDVPKPQVMIEAKIIEVSTDYTQNLGIRWGGTITGSNVKNFPDTTNAEFSVNTPITAATGPGGILNLTIGTAATTQVNLSLEAIETVGKTKKLSNPKLLTMDNVAASIQQGVSIPVQTTTAAGSTTEFVNANLNLNVTPKITPEGYIQMKISAANDTPVSVGGSTGINKQSIQTEALVKNGETLVLGGIYTRTDQTTSQGVPLLSKIPIIGWLFKTKEVQNPTKELLIFITPVIVDKGATGI